MLILVLWSETMTSLAHLRELRSAVQAAMLLTLSATGAGAASIELKQGADGESSLIMIVGEIELKDDRRFKDVALKVANALVVLHGVLLSTVSACRRLKSMAQGMNAAPIGITDCSSARRVPRHTKCFHRQLSSPSSPGRTPTDETKSSTCLACTSVDTSSGTSRSCVIQTAVPPVLSNSLTPRRTQIRFASLSPLPARGLSR
jgi:hypothetical protein